MKHAAVISLSIMSYLLATDIYTPSMPEIERYFDATANDVQKTMSYFLFGAVMACLSSGLFAESFGRKRFLIFGTTLAAIGSLFTIFCPTLELLILGRFLQGLGAGVGPVIGYSALQELYDEKQQTKIYGMLGVALASVPAVAPFLGSLIAVYYGWHLIFIFIFVLFSISLICIWKLLPDSLNITTPSSTLDILKSYRSIVTNRTFMALALLSPLFNAVEWFYLTFLPFYMQDNIGISKEMYGIIVGILIIWFAIGSYFGSKFIEWFDNHRTIQIGLYSGLGAAALLWMISLLSPNSVLGISIALSMFLFGFGVLYPSTVRTSLNIFKDASTRASSIRSLFITGFAYVGSFSAELVDDTKLSRLALFVSICSLLAIAVYQMRIKLIK